MKKALFACAALALAASLQAQEMQYGFHAELALPQGDVKTALDNAMGFGAGFQMLIPVSGGHVVRPRIDYRSFSGKDVSQSLVVGSRTYTISYKDKLTHIGAGADYLYFIDGKPEGFYVTAGLGYVNLKEEVTFTGLPAGAQIASTTSATKGALGYAAGAGWKFNRNLAAEVRYNAAKINNSEGKVDQMNVVTAGVSLTF